MHAVTAGMNRIFYRESKKLCWSNTKGCRLQGGRRLAQRKGLVHKGGGGGVWHSQGSSETTTFLVAFPLKHSAKEILPSLTNPRNMKANSLVFVTVQCERDVAAVFRPPALTPSNQPSVPSPIYSSLDVDHRGCIAAAKSVPTSGDERRRR